MTALTRLKPEAQQHILWLHQKAFSGKVACEPCKGRCCVSCAGSRGYLPPAEFEAAKKKYGFDGKTDGWPIVGKGFLTEKGCAIPVEERSIVCLGYICDGVVYKENADWRPDQKPDDSRAFNVEQIHAADQIKMIGWDPKWKA